ncbi:MAG TPA: hypothetical protein VHM72_00015 [Solirubrobacteraceae bacterium]|nr:hypothetical protein [Solirubrobacteraceae bacterium]
MLGDKQEHFEGKGTDLGALQSHIEEYLKNDGFEVHTSAPSDQGSVIQAKKGGFLAGVIDADRALTITIVGSSADFTVRVGVGKWLKDLEVGAIETLVLGELFLVIDVAESAWNLEIEAKLVNDIKSFVG